MASPGYDAKYRQYDEATGRVIAASLLSPDVAAAELGSDRCGGALTVPDDQYEPWGTPHGGVIAELAARCMAVQVIAAADEGVEPWLITSAYQFRRRWTRGESLCWTTRAFACGEFPHARNQMAVSVEASLEMAGRVVTSATGTFLAVPAGAAPAASAAERAAAYLGALPSPESLRLPVHRAGWEAGRIEGYFEQPAASPFFALDEAMAAAANTVRGDARGDDVAEDFLLADMDLTCTGAPGTATEYEATIRRGRSGRDGIATARLLDDGRVLAYGRGRVAFLHREPAG